MDVDFGKNGIFKMNEASGSLGGQFRRGLGFVLFCWFVDPDGFVQGEDFGVQSRIESLRVLGAGRGQGR